MHTVAQSDSRSLHTPGGAGVTGVVSMLTGPAGEIGNGKPGPVGTAGLAPGTEEVVGLAGTGTAGVAPGLDKAGATGPEMLGDAGVVGEMLGEVTLPGAGTSGVPGMVGTPPAGAAVVEGTGEPALLDGLAGMPDVGDTEVEVAGLLGLAGDKPVFGKTGEATLLGLGLD